MNNLIYIFASIFVVATEIIYILYRKNSTDDWVEKEKWRDIAEGKVDLTPAQKSTTTNDRIDDELNKAKRKVIRVYDEGTR
jgi:hypothetical protein